MRPYSLTITPDAADANGLAAINASSGATLTIDGALASGGSFTSADLLGRRIIITDLGGHDQTGATYVLAGMNASGQAISESIAGPSASGSVTTTLYFYTVDALPTISSPVASSTVDVGTVDEVESKVIPMNFRAHEAASYQVIVSGTVAYTVKETLDDVHRVSAALINWLSLASMSAATATSKKLGLSHSRATTIVFDSYTSGASTVFTVYQNEN